MNIKGLTKTKGTTYEEVISTLDRLEIPFDIDGEPETQHDFFRSSRIFMSQEGYDAIVKTLGTENTRNMPRGGLAYNAHYDIDKNNFDFSQLNGRITFSEGSILERTVVEIAGYEM